MSVTRWSLSLLLALSLVATSADAVDSLATVRPIGVGPYPVACSDLTQDFSRVAAGQLPSDYWNGAINGSYVASLLVASNAFGVSVRVPFDFELYGRYLGTTINVVSLICYPTSTGNTRADYALPNGKAIPHMQRGAEGPIWPDAAARFPVLIFSHGLAGSPISSDYIEAIKLFASFGYVVVAPFHGDLRIADISIANLSDFGYVALHALDFIALQALRPLEIKAVLDSFLARSEWASHVDANRIGAFGASLGGETVMLLGGAGLTNTLGLSWKPVLRDDRIKAAVGYVPYFGQSFFPAFGRDQGGLAEVTLPYLAISGTADTTAPIGPTRIGIQRLTNTHELVALQGVQHGFDPAFSSDIFTWTLTFLAGQLSGDPAARAQSARMTSVDGGGADVLEQDYVAPSPAAADERVAVEFYNASLDHYFFTAEPAEVAMLDAGSVVPGWARTRFDFKVWPAGAQRGLYACRFFGTPGIGPNSHFFTIDQDECEKVKNNRFWTFEGLAFNADLPSNEDCPADRVPVIRLYNNGKGGQANHRYSTSHSEIGDMAGQGWIVEGAVFCALP